MRNVISYMIYNHFLTNLESYDMKVYQLLSHLKLVFLFFFALLLFLNLTQNSVNKDLLFYFLKHYKILKRCFMKL